MRYLVVLETAPGRTDYGVTVPDLPGCTSAGDTLDEALGNAEDAILSYLGVLVEDGKPLRHRLATCRSSWARMRWWASSTSTARPAAPGRGRRREPVIPWSTRGCRRPTDRSPRT